MKPFFEHDCLLSTPTAKSLFQEVVNLPVTDAFTKLTAKEIAENSQFENITELLIDRDPKKLEAMRFFGIDEYYITGEAGAFERFQKWAETLPCLIGNPLYYRSHFELQKFFSVQEPLSPATAEKIWTAANQKIQTENLSIWSLFKQFGVTSLHTPQDPTASLVWHQKIAEDGLCPAKVYPSFCADKALSPTSSTFKKWVEALAESCSASIATLADLQARLVERLLFFKSLGAKSAIQMISLSKLPECSYETADAAFQKAKNQLPLTQSELSEYQGVMLQFLAKKYQDYGFTMAIQTTTEAASHTVITLLEQLSREHKLPKILLATTEPSHYPSLAKAAVSSKISGSIRLFFKGMPYQKDDLHFLLKAVSQNGLLPCFAGICAGGNSVLSYPFYEYFRQILCDFLGNLVESGEYPNYADLLKKFVKDITFETLNSYL